MDVEMGMEYRNISKIESNGVGNWIWKVGNSEEPKTTAQLSNLPTWRNTDVVNMKKENGKVCRSVEDNLV